MDLLIPQSQLGKQASLPKVNVLPAVREVLEAMREAGDRFDKLRLHLINRISEDTLRSAALDLADPVVRILLEVDRPAALVPRLRINDLSSDVETEQKIQHARRILTTLAEKSSKADQVLRQYAAVRPTNRQLIPAEVEPWFMSRQLSTEDRLHTSIVNVRELTRSVHVIVFDFYRLSSISREEANTHFDESSGLYAIRTMQELQQLVGETSSIFHGRTMGQLGRHSIASGESSITKDFFYSRGLSVFHDCLMGKYSYEILKAKAYDLQRVFFIIDLFAALRIPFSLQHLQKSFEGTIHSPDPLMIVGLPRKLLEIRRCCGEEEVNTELFEQLADQPDVKKYLRQKTRPSVVVVPVSESNGGPHQEDIAAKIPCKRLTRYDEYQLLVRDLVASANAAEKPLSTDQINLLTRLERFYVKGIIARHDNGIGTISLDQVVTLVQRGATLAEIREEIGETLRMARALKDTVYAGQSISSEERSLTPARTEREIKQNSIVVTQHKRVDDWIATEKTRDKIRAALVGQRIARLGSGIRPGNEKIITKLGRGVFECRVPGAQDLRIIYQRRGTEVKILWITVRPDLDRVVALLHRDPNL